MKHICTTQPTDEDQPEHGSMVDPQGNEVQITEQMIQQACDILAKQLPNHHAVAAERSYS